MKKYIPLLLMTVFLSSCCVLKKRSDKEPDLNLLASYMEGSFSSEEQAKQDTNFLHITLDMKRIWTERTDGIWLYVEQAAAWTPGKPYRQRIYHLEQLDKNTFTSTICTMPNPKNYTGGHLNPTLFKTLVFDSVKVLPGCALKLDFKNGVFKGSTEVGACLNSWGKATYATSDVEIKEGVMYSWDRGWNEEGKQVWGAVTGGYLFVKKE